MARIIELRAALKAAKDAGFALVESHQEAAKTAGYRGFTPEEKAAQAAAEQKVAGLTELVEAEERKLAAEAADSSKRAASGTSRVEVKAPNADADPRRGFRSHRDFIESVMAAAGKSDRSQVADERLKPLAVADKDDRAAGGELAFMLPVAFTPPSVHATVGSDEHGNYDDSRGGYLVNKTRLPGLLQVGFEGDPTMGRTQSVPMGTPTVEIPARADKTHTTSVSGGFTVARKAEAAAAAASRGQFELVTLKASSLFGLSYITEELLTDSPQSFIALVDAGFRDQFGAYMLNEKLRGTGGDQFLGILSALSASNQGPTISVAKETGQVADTIVHANVVKMRSRCWGYGSAIWIGNHDIYPSLSTMNVGIGASGALVYQQSVVEDRPDMLLGRPIYYSEYASTIGDQGDLILANWSQFLEGVYQPLQSAESMHVRFVNHERTLKFWLRNAGAPWWRTPITPAKSTATLSPFVVLDAR